MKIQISRQKRKSQRGVTLIEMLVVVVIIGLIASLVAVNVFKQGETAKRKLARTDIDTFINALSLYKLDTGSFPSTAMGLEALRVRPEGVNNWAGPYLQKDVPLDQWSHPFQYKYPGEHGDEPDIISLGSDGQPGGEGDNADVVSWSTKQ
jgi:general secretion pathway protein G